MLFILESKCAYNIRGAGSYLNLDVKIVYLTIFAKFDKCFMHTLA
jgi:hypothetical protein